MAEKNHLGEYLKRTYPNTEKLKVDKQGGIHTTIVDAELDRFECKFNNDGCVEIHTEGYSHITLDRNTLIRLAKLIEKADQMYENRTEKQWEKYELKS